MPLFGRSASTGSSSSSDLDAAKRIIVTTPHQELACERGSDGTMRCLRGGPPIRLSNGSVLALGSKPRARPVQLPPRQALSKKTATADPPFCVVKFMSVLPRSNRARIERQLEILTALQRTSDFPGVWQVHLMVRSLDDAVGMLKAFQYQLPPRVAAIHELGRMPLNSDFVQYAYTHLRGEWVLACNDDIYLEGAAWLKPPTTGGMLSLIHI